MVIAANGRRVGWRYSECADKCDVDGTRDEKRLAVFLMYYSCLNIERKGNRRRNNL